MERITSSFQCGCSNMNHRSSRQKEARLLSVMLVGLKQPPARGTLRGQNVAARLNSQVPRPPRPKAPRSTSKLYSKTLLSALRSVTLPYGRYSSRSTYTTHVSRRQHSTSFHRHQASNQARLSSLTTTIASFGKRLRLCAKAT